VAFANCKQNGSHVTRSQLSKPVRCKCLWAVLYLAGALLICHGGRGKRNWLY
jgi:hypothetical protein